ncbi:MAG: nicotinate-nucleotide adenylyltransferase [Verrucomicrobiota bacterium]|jgi:nicotinate-nucleotide adenylyltransferase
MATKKIPGHVERVGLFGGSFDPIHLGHLILAEAAMEELQLDRIIFIPAGVSPFKTDRPPGASADQRLSMVRGAIKDEPRFSVDERELRREGPSYTFETVRSLLGDYPGVRFIYLIGADNLADLHKWYEIEELKNLVDFALLDRGNAISDAETEFPVVRRRIDLSSTEIRERVIKGLSIRFMVPASVYDTVMTSHLYLTSSHGNV